MSAALEKAAAARVYQDNAKPNYGRYRFEILGHRLHNGFHGNFLISELRVIESEDLGSVEAPEGATPPPTERASRVGSTVSYSENIDNVKKGGADRFQTHLARLLDSDKPLNLPQLRLITGQDGDAKTDQPTFGLLVDCEVRPKWIAPDPKKGYTTGKWLKNFRWSTVDDQPIDEINRKRAAAGLKGDLTAALDELESLGG